MKKLAESAADQSSATATHNAFGGGLKTAGTASVQKLMMIVFFGHLNIAINIHKSNEFSINLVFVASNFIFIWKCFLGYSLDVLISYID